MKSFTWTLNFGELSLTYAIPEVHFHRDKTVLILLIKEKSHYNTDIMQGDFCSGSISVLSAARKGTSLQLHEESASRKTIQK